MAQILSQKKRYEPKFIFSTVKNDIIMIFFFILAVFYIKLSPFPIKSNLIVGGIIALFGLIIVFFNLTEVFKKLWVSHNSLKNISYYNTKMDTFVELTSIKNNVAHLKDKSIIAYLRVVPKDLNILSDEEKMSVISAYRQFLNSLEDEVQIVSRSVPIDLDSWLYNKQSKIKSRGDSEKTRLDLKSFDSFKKWINSIMENGSVRNRVFYVVIRSYGTKKLEGFDILKQFFSDLSGIKFESSKVNLKDGNLALKDLDDRILNYTDILIKMGVEVKRLNNNEILSMFSGYFNDVEGIDTNYVTPMMWPEDE